MSTSPTPGARVQPATGWYPNLNGTGLPRAAVNGIQQSFTMLYALRDTVNQQKNTLDKSVQYDNHLNRLQTNAEAMPDCALWFESDRRTVFYQTRLKMESTTREWFYAGGIHYDLLANRPTDLAGDDLGFLFLGSDDHHLYHWNGTAWDVAI